MQLRFSLALAIWLAASAASAVLISSGDGSGNTTQPPDDPGFDHLGTMSTGPTGVYLGERWVLTANHVGAKSIDFLGSVYDPVPETATRLENPGGGFVDLLVYRIDGVPPVPAAVLPQNPVQVNEVVTCIGNGWDRETSQTTWNVNWEESPPPTYRGFKRDLGLGFTRRWGQNEVDSVGGSVLNTESFAMNFDQNGLANEFVSVVGDSGGPCFAKRSGVWELAGIMFATSTFGDPNAPEDPPPGQPPNTAVYNNTTHAADIEFYRDAIEALTVPPEIPALPLAPTLALAGTLVGVAARRLTLRR